ncbi:MAG: hypothetical protein ACRELA_19665 [Candidatus Rokuibacteriota bacterium]
MPLSSLALACFLLSGFASLIYQITWLRQTMALFGAATPTVATMLSIFMGGLTLGSYLAGRWTRDRSTWQTLLAYVAAEGVIGLGGIAATPLMETFRQTPWWLEAPSVGTRWSMTFGFLVMALAPWTLAMGATYPLFLRSVARRSGPTFGWLYAANVAGAMLGTLAAAYVLVEYLGFRQTQWVGVAANAIAALFALTWWAARREGTEASLHAPAPPTPSGGSRPLVVATFLIGFVSLAYEVVWTRLYTPVLGTVVYAFAGLLATYLGATCFGTVAYRWSARRGMRTATAHRWLGPLVIASAVLPHVVVTTAWLSSTWKLVLGLGPFCWLTGFWTPLLVEEYGAGQAERVGRVYAWNGLGCLLGPLVAGFVLLPFLGSGVTLLVLTSLLAVPAAIVPTASRIWALIPALALVPVFTLVPTYEQRIGSTWILHDSTATVAALGEDRFRRLLVNGVSMTGLVNETKWMVHLPSLMHGAPKTILIVCFGMGTSFRSALAWQADVTSVELVPSVPRLFAYYHRDAEAVARDPRGRIVIDDGRHFLETTMARYDIIVVDPPPPLEAAGSSMLNSREFFAAARRALNPGGLLLHWTPGGDFFSEVAQATTLADVFPHVVAFRSPGRVPGLYMIASNAPLRVPKLPEAVDAAPATVREDMGEWLGGNDVVGELARILSRRITREEIVAWSPGATPLVDDFPVNEYQWVRRQATPLARTVAGLLGLPPVARRLDQFARREWNGEPATSPARDPRFSIYRLATAFHRYAIAAQSIQAVAARYPESAETRELAADALRRWESEHADRSAR